MRSLTTHRLVIASGNVKKALELQSLVSHYGLEIISAPTIGAKMPQELTVEEGGTFYGNARIKAESITSQSGEWALADDSGLCVESLDGRPGVDTALYGSWEKLLAEMAALDKRQRTAIFRCVLALARPNMETVFFEGECAGEIAWAGKGEGGFGFDPVFIPKGENRTFAEMSAEEKAQYSHRGMAMRMFSQWLKDYVNA
jgi:XTP/dITP diphosphohydrolase